MNKGKYKALAIFGLVIAIIGGSLVFYSSGIELPDPIVNKLWAPDNTQFTTSIGVPYTLMTFDGFKTTYDPDRPVKVVVYDLDVDGRNIMDGGFCRGLRESQCFQLLDDLIPESIGRYDFYTEYYQQISETRDEYILAIVPEKSQGIELWINWRLEFNKSELAFRHYPVLSGYLTILGWLSLIAGLGIGAVSTGYMIKK